jgi:hypothetical protein
MEEVVENNKYIENPIFTAYIQQIPFQEILDSNIADGIIVYELNNQANKLLLAIGECIITDTNGISSSNNYKKLKGLTDGARGKYLLPNDSISDIASGLTKSLDLGETVNQLGDIKNQIGDAIGDAKDKIGNAIGDAIGAVSTDFKNVTEVVTSEPASETMYSNSRPVTPRKSFVSPLSSRIMTPIKVGGGTRKRRFVKVPKITRNQKLKKRKQTRNPRRKQTRRTNKRTRKHRN